MENLLEQIWKSRFVECLAGAFTRRGLRLADAIEDAVAHADDYYPGRGQGTPEQEAIVVLKSLSDG